MIENVYGQWVDSSAIHFVCYDENYFKIYTPFEVPKTIMLGDHITETLGKGDVELTFTSQSIIVLKYLLYTPYMRKKIYVGKTNYKNLTIRS